MVEIIAPGKTAHFARGNRLAPGESPVHPVHLSIPYAISRCEITNSQPAFIFNIALEKKHAAIHDGGIWDGSNKFRYPGIKSAGTEIQGAQNGDVLMMRGGELSSPQALRVEASDSAPPDSAVNDAGFRVARSIID